MKSQYLIVLLILSIHTLSAQTPDIKRGDIYLGKKEFANALKYYHHALKRKVNRDNYSLLAKTAFCHKQLNQNTEAEKNYRRLYSLQTKPDSNNLHFAHTLKKNGKFEEARSHYIKLTTEFPQNAYYESLVLSCDSAIHWQNNSDSSIEIIHLKKLNSEFSDATPFVSGNRLVFASNREEVIIQRKTEQDQEPYFNLYTSTIDTGSQRITMPRPFSRELNTMYHETAPSFTADGRKVYFTRCQDIQRKDTIDNVNRLKLYCSELENNKWTRPHKFIFNDSTCSYAHPSIESNERMFFFASDMKGGYGGVDIYVCLNIDNKWTNPINLGPHVNTPGDEMYPYYHPDGSLYFASNYHIGLGGFDIFRASEINGEWSNVTNMKAPVNSQADDFALYLDKNNKIGFFTSNRPGGLGKEDLYKVVFKNGR